MTIRMRSSAARHPAAKPAERQSQVLRMVRASPSTTACRRDIQSLLQGTTRLGLLLAECPLEMTRLSRFGIDLL
jgi:hypothetical protein